MPTSLNHIVDAQSEQRPRADSVAQNLQNHASNCRFSILKPTASRFPSLQPILSPVLGYKLGNDFYSHNSEKKIDAKCN